MSAHIVSQQNRLCRGTSVSGAEVKEGNGGVGSGLLSHGVAPALPSTLVDFTAGFGMGPGVSPPLLPPTPPSRFHYVGRTVLGCGSRFLAFALLIQFTQRWARNAPPCCARKRDRLRSSDTLRTKQDKESLL